MDARKADRKDRALKWGARIWLAVVIAFSVWEAMSYSGVSAYLAEWQYNEIGTFYPSLTYTLMVGVLSLPLLVIARLRKGGGRSSATALVRPHDAAHAATKRLRDGFVVAAIVTAVAMLAIGVFALMLPDGAGPARVVNAMETTAPVPVGAAELRGVVLYDKIAVLNEDSLLNHSRDRFAPVVEAGGSQSTLQYFVELPSDGAAGLPANAAYRGILRRGGLPGDLEKIYRYAGYKIPRDYYVLFSSRAAMLRNYANYTADLFVLLVFFVIMQAICWFRLRQIEKAALAANEAAAEMA